MRTTYKALIVVAALAAGRAWAQEPSTPVEVSPTPVAAQPASEAPQAAPAVSNPEALAPAQLAPIPKDAAPATEVQPAPAPAPEAVSAPPSQQAAPVAPAAPSKTVNKAEKPRKHREATAVRQPASTEPVPQEANPASASAAGVASSDAGQMPPSAGTTVPEAAIPPAPVAEQRPVVVPSEAAEQPQAPRTSSTMLLVGGLLLGIGGIVTMLARRHRDDSVSIIDHDLPTISTRPPVVRQRSRTTTESLS